MKEWENIAGSSFSRFGGRGGIIWKTETPKKCVSKHELDSFTPAKKHFEWTQSCQNYQVDWLLQTVFHPKFQASGTLTMLSWKAITHGVKMPNSALNAFQPAKWPWQWFIIISQFTKFRKVSGHWHLSVSLLFIFLMAWSNSIKTLGLRYRVCLFLLFAFFMCFSVPLLQNKSIAYNH